MIPIVDKEAMNKIRVPALYTTLGVLIVLAIIGGQSLVSSKLQKSNVIDQESEAVAPTPTIAVTPTNTPTSAPTAKPQKV